MPLPLSTALFLIGAAAIWYGGSRLPEAGSRVAEKLGISETTLGLFVLSFVTSLPELSVTIFAMVSEGAPDLAFGNILGSNNFNVTSIVALEFMTAGVFLHHVDKKRYSRTCGYILVLTAVAGLGVLLGPRLPLAVPPLLFSLPILVLFVYDSFLHGKTWRRVGPRKYRRKPGIGTGHAVAWFGLYSAAVVAGGFAIASGANGIAGHQFGGGFQLGQTFVGTLLVAVATSMPEVAVAYAAVRRSKLEDMALGTILGSNTLNLMVFAIGAPLLAIRFTGSAWSHLGIYNLISVATALILTTFALVGISSRSTRIGVGLTRTLLALMVPVYIIGLYLVYRGTV